MDGGGSSQDGSAADGTAPDGGSVTPITDPCPSVTSKRFAFVTSASAPGDLGGHVGATARCNALAQFAGLPGSGSAGGYQALISDATSQVKGFPALQGVKVVLPVKGLCPIVADDFSKLMADGPTSPIEVNEFGKTIPAGACPVWTGSNSDGTVAMGLTCSDWSHKLVALQGVVGDCHMQTSSWLNTQVPQTCDQQARLYCVQVAQ